MGNVSQAPAHTNHSANTTLNIDITPGIILNICWKILTNISINCKGIIFLSGIKEQISVDSNEKVMGTLKVNANTEASYFCYCHI